MANDGKYHCPHCNYSTQLINKFERHLKKKHKNSSIVILIMDDEEE